MTMKKALLVGINYPNSSHSLRGCINDVMLMSDVLTRNFQFSANNKRMLTDNAATTQNILERLEWLVDDAKSGDVLYFHYSGHGSQMIDNDYDNDVEPDGLDEIICPIDLNWRDRVIKDDDLRRIFDKLPDDVNLTVTLDCCHSGSGIDSTHQFMPTGVALEDHDPFGQKVNKSRLLPMPADIANRGMGIDFKPKTREVPAHQGGILISGCQAHQTSADSYIGNKFMGAATYFLVRNLQLSNFNIEYNTLVTNMNNELARFGYTQRPELNGSPQMFGKTFLKPFV